MAGNAGGAHTEIFFKLRTFGKTPVSGALHVKNTGKKSAFENFLTRHPARAVVNPDKNRTNATNSNLTDYCPLWPIDNKLLP